MSATISNYHPNHHPNRPSITSKPWSKRSFDTELIPSSVLSSSRIENKSNGSSVVIENDISSLPMISNKNSKRIWSNQSNTSKSKSKYSPEKKIMRSTSSRKLDSEVVRTSNIDSITKLTDATAHGYGELSMDMLININMKATLTLTELNILMRNLGDHGKLESCELVLNFMKAYDIQPSVITYSTFISRAGMWKHILLAEKMFHIMTLSGIKPDVQAYNSLINAYAKAENIEKAMQIFHQMIIQSKIKPTVITFNTLIDGCARAGLAKNAQQILLLMKEFNVIPNIRTYSSIIHAWCEVKNLDAAIEILTQMERKNMQPSPVTYSIIIHELGRTGKLDQAFEMLESLKVKNIPVNFVTMSSLIDACGKAGRLEKAFELYYDMLKSPKLENQPNSITGSSLVDACLKVGEVDKALSILKDMKERKVQLTAVTYTSLITELTKLKMLDRILEFALQDVFDDGYSMTTDITQQVKKSIPSHVFPNSAKSISNSRPILTNTITIVGNGTAIGQKEDKEEKENDEESLLRKTSSLSLSSSSTSLSTTIVSNSSSSSNGNNNNNNNSDSSSISTDSMVITSFVTKLKSDLDKMNLEIERVLSLTKQKQFSIHDIESVRLIGDIAKSFTEYLPTVRQISDILRDTKDVNSIQINGFTFDNHTREMVTFYCQEIRLGQERARRILQLYDLFYYHDLFQTNLISSSSKNNFESIYYSYIDDNVIKILSPLKIADEAIAQYEVLKIKGVTPDKNIYNNIVQSLYEISVKRSSSVGQSKGEQQLRNDDLFRLYLVYQEMKHNPRIQIDAPVYNTLIDACAGVGDVQRALETLQSMREEGVYPTVITYTSLIKACEIHGGKDMIVLAEELFTEMEQRSNHFSNYIAPTQITFHTLLHVHFTVPADEVNTVRVLQLLDDMLIRGLQPSVRAFRLCIRATVLSMNVEKALDILDLMRKIKSIRFDFRSWFMVVELCHSKEWYDEKFVLLKEIEMNRNALLKFSNHSHN